MQGGKGENRAMPNNCVDGLPLSEEQLFAVLDGAAPPSILNHLERCPSCRERYTVLRTTEQKLRRLLNASHIPPVELAAYRVGLLPSEAQTQITQHLESCDYCRRTLSELEAFAGLGNTEPVRTPEPTPRPLRKRLAEIALQIVRTGASAGAEAVGGYSLNLMGGEMSMTPRLLLAEAEGVKVTLELDRIGGQVRLSGSVVTDDYSDQRTWEGAMMQIYQNNQIVATAALDRRGMFECAPVPPVISTIRIRRISGRPLALYNLAID